MEVLLSSWLAGAFEPSMKALSTCAARRHDTMACEEHQTFTV
jgi:hypothetical protein